MAAKPGTAVALVAGQFACILVLFLGSWWLPWWAWAMLGAGLVVFMLAAGAIGKHNITAMPGPREGNTLSKRGIYRVVRHPMYTSMLLCGAALALGQPAWWRTAAWLLVLAVLLLKINFEERRLAEKLLHGRADIAMSRVVRW